MNLYPALTKEQKQEIYNFFIEFMEKSELYINYEREIYNKESFINSFDVETFIDTIKKNDKKYFFSLSNSDFYSSEKLINEYFKNNNKYVDIFTFNVNNLIYDIKTRMIPFSVFENYRNNIMSLIPVVTNELISNYSNIMYGTPIFKKTLTNFINEKIIPFISSATTKKFNHTMNYDYKHSRMKIEFDSKMNGKEKTLFFNSFSSFRTKNKFKFDFHFKDGYEINKATNTFIISFKVNNYPNIGMEEMIDCIPDIFAK